MQREGSELNTEDDEGLTKLRGHAALETPAGTVILTGTHIDVLKGPEANNMLCLGS